MLAENDSVFAHDRASKCRCHVRAKILTASKKEGLRRWKAKRSRTRCLAKKRLAEGCTEDPALRKPRTAQLLGAYGS